MFYFWKILKKIKERNARIKIIQDIIKVLHIDEKQKQLYLESLFLIEDEWLNNLYLQLSALIAIDEDNEIIEEFWKNKTVINPHTEVSEKQKEMNSLNLLLETI